jgi:hypothetical protein
LAIVTAAENHFLAPNDNHDFADRRIWIAPDRNCRRSVFAANWSMKTLTNPASDSMASGFTVL